MNKRITSLLLSIVMVFSMIVVAVPVYAADITPLYIKPDKTEASPGDTISYEVIMGPVANLAYMKIKLVIPEGLTYVSGSGTDAEGIEEKMNTSTAEYTDSTKVWLVQDANYTSTENTLLFMFKCTVDEKASGVKAITLTMDPDDNFDTSDDNITMDDSALGSEVTIKSSAPTTYTVSFNANGGTGTMADVTGVSGEYTLPENGFTAPAGKQFKAWSVDGTEKAVGDIITVTADTEVKAVWEDIPVVTYTVSFNANGGTGTMADVTGVSGEYTLPENGFTAPAGKQFKAWEVNGTEKAVGDTITVTADTEVKAVWEDIPVTAVTYDIDVIDGVATNRNGAVITEAEEESIVYITADSAPRGKEFREWVILSRNVTLDNAKSARTSFEMPAADVEIIAVYQDKESDFDSDRWYWSIMQLFNQKFTVSASAGEGGSITNEGKTTVKYNNSITYIITPDDGYEIEAVYVNGKNVGAVDEYKFRGVKSNQTIEATFVKTGWDNPFIDIFETDSYYDAIEYVYENKLFKGVSAIEFAPDTTMTRAMFVTVLGRLADVDEDEYTETSFEDVIPGTWYASYVEWAADNGIVNGYGNGLFGVEDEITIEQAVVILARFADYIGIDLDTNAVLDRFFDADEIADWAVEAMMWAVDDEIYEGINGRLNPKAPAKRWMLAEILLAFDEAYGE